MITIDDFAKLEIKIGTITSCEKVENADKLLRLTVNFGDETRQIISGIAQFYSPEQLVGLSIPVLTNLEPKTFRGAESHGMILAVDNNGKPVLLTPQEEVTPGAHVR